MDELLDNFKKKFDLSNNGFSEPIDLKDDKVIGFSVFKEQVQLQRRGFKSLYHVYIKREEFNKEDDKKSIIITAVYGKMTNGGLVSYSSDFKIGSKWPVELFSEGEFFYNTKTQDLFYNNEIISGIKLLQLIDAQHLKPSRPIKGAWFRAKKFYYYSISTFLKLLFFLFSSIQYLFSGKKVNFYLFEKDSINPEAKLGKHLKIFEYIVEAWIGVIYALIHFVAYCFLLYYDVRPLWLITIFKNPFLTVMYVIISLGLLDATLSKLPRFYFMGIILAFLRERYIRVVSKRIKI